MNLFLFLLRHSEKKPDFKFHVLPFKLFLSFGGERGLWVNLKTSVSFLLLAESGFLATRLNYNSDKAYDDITSWVRQI